MRSDIDFLAIGELLADIISTEYVEDLSSVKSFQLHAGGSPANVCANLKWLGLNSVLVSCVGEDSIGDFLLRAIEKIGLDKQFIRRSHTHPTSIVLVARSTGTPDFIAYRSADTQLQKVDPELIMRSAIVHTCAFALSRNPAQYNILEALSYAASLRKIISVDWNYAPSMWESDGQMVFQKICSLRPLLKVSLDDMTRFTGKPCSAEDAMTFLDRLKCRMICLTCGKDGVWYKVQDENQWRFKEADVVPDVKDTTGAGDAFWAGFIAEYSKGAEPDACIVNGINIAARKIQKFGPLYA